MGAFDRARKLIIPGKNKNKSSGNDDFDFDELSEMSDDFSDDHEVSSSRKSSIKSYVKDHYSAKLNDSAERKRLVKAALPASYSGTIDLASDLRDDLSSMRYELGKEWEKQSGSVKKTLRGFEKQLKFLRLNKLVDYANSSSGRSSYQDDPVSQNEALVASMLGEFVNPGGGASPREIQQRQKQQLKEKEDVAEYRTKSLHAQLRGTVSSEQTVSELRKLTNYQDQVTYVYQKKSLEVQIRSFVEHKTQTELLRAYKDESMAELKEIHKNTGLPDAVKINQNELAAQVFKEKMLGNISNWFDGSTANIRKRVTNRIRSKLLDMTKNFGSSLESFIGMTGADDEQGGGGMAKFLMSMGIDAALDKPYDKATNSITGRIRNKLSGNSRINKLGRRLNALTRNAGMFANNALVTGETGNSLLDGIIDFFGFRQDAIVKNDKVRGSLAENLDTASYMDVKFKQTVERVIPGWLSLIHKETKLLRTGQKDDKGYQQIQWDWSKEDFIGKEDKEKRVLAQVMNRDKVVEHSEAYERLLHHFDSYSLSRKTVDKLRNWLFKRIRGSRTITLYDLLVDAPRVFDENERQEIYIMANVQGGIDQSDVEGIKTGLVSELALTRRDLYSRWLINLAPLYQQVAGKELIDWKKIQELAAQGEEKILEEHGYLIRDSSGNLMRNNDFEEEIFNTHARFKHKKMKHYKDGEATPVIDLDGKKSTRGTYVLDESKTDSSWEDMEYNLELENSDINRLMNRWLTTDVLDERDREKLKSFSKTKAGQHFLMRVSEAKKRGLLDNFTRASGGYIPSFAKGGPTGDHLSVDTEIHAKLHGKEFITDKETTEKNRRLLEFMNKFKAPVVMPDGSVNPIYYKAFGFKTEEEFKNSDTDTRLTREQSRFFRDIKNAGNNEAAYNMVAELFTSLDLNSISNADLTKLVSPRTPTPEKFKIFLELRKKQEAKGNKKSKQDWLGSGIAKVRNLVEGTGPETEALGKNKKKAKDYFNRLKASLSNMSDEQLNAFVNKTLGTLDESTLTDDQLETLTDPSISPREKAIFIAKLSLARKDKAKVAKDAISSGLKAAKDAAKSKAKDLINGPDGDTTNTDNLKAIADKGTGYVKGKVGSLKALAESGQLDETMKGLGNKAAEKLRLQKALSLGKKFWSDQPIDIYLRNKPDLPVLTMVGFVNGEYIDHETNRVLSSHHDITGPVKNREGSFILLPEHFEVGLIDSEGKPIFINGLKRYRNIAKEKATQLYNKYGKKYVNKGADALLSATEKWQAMFKKTAIDIYVGDGKEPRLTEAGFREGKYVSALTKKPLSGYLDIDGPVITADGTMLITTDELTNSPLSDKDGNPVRPPKLMSNMGRLGTLVWNALSFDKAYGAGKKAFNKLKERYKNWKAKQDKKDEEDEENPLSTKPATRWGSKLKSKMKSLVGYETGEDGTKGLRIGSWQWKRKKKEEEGWMSKFAGLFGKGKDKEESKKKGIMGKLLGLVGGIGTGLFTLANNIGKIFSGSLFSVAKWLVPSLGKNLFKGLAWIAKPILSSLTFIGKGVLRQASGRGIGIGRMAKIGGLAAGGYMAYQGLKGSEKLDENGQPVLDENGQPVTERDWGSIGMGAATMALSTGAGLKTAGSLIMGAGTALRVGAGILSGPVGWAALGATAAYYGGKWALGKWRKGQAAKTTPLLAFRVNQYGFDVTNEDVLGKLMQLESTLQPNLAIQGEKINFKADMDVESVFGIFGLKYQGGDAEKNKKFLTWFLGRFKPVYIAHVRALNLLKKKTDLSTLDADVQGQDAVTYLDKVHFKNQMEMNPYNILVSPFEDPDKASYDFEDMEGRYKKTKSILDEAAAKVAKVSTESKDGEGKESKEEEGSTASTVAKAALMATPAGGIVAGSIWALKKLSTGAGDIFNKTATGMEKAVGSFVDTLTSKVSDAWNKVKSIGSSIADGAGAVVDGAMDIGSGIASGAGRAVEWIGNIGQGGKTEATLVEAAQKAGITDPEELAMLLAQASHESGGFKYAKEIGKDSYFQKYDNRKDLGNGPGDGARFKGRGWIQITGRANYAAFSKWAGIDAVSNPELLEKEPYSSLATIWFWTQHSNMTRMGRKAAQEGNVEKATKAVNGGQNGLADRKQRYAKYIEMVKKGEIGGGTASTGAAPGAGVLKPGVSPQAAPAGVKSQAANIVGDASAATSGGSGSAPAPGAGVLKPGAPAGSAKVSSGAPAAPAKVSNGVTGATGGLASVLAKCTPDLVALGKTHYRKKNNSVTFDGMNPTFMTLFWAMLGEAKKKGLAVVQVNDAMRSLAEQKRLYALYKAGKGSLAAYPGTSRHGFGQAIDINTVNAEALIKAGLFEKYGFTRPLLKKGETWHVENKWVPKGNAPNPNVGSPNKGVVTVTSSTPSIDNVTYQGSPVNASSSNGISNVMASGGFAATPSISASQQSDMAGLSTTNNILNKQLNVQTEIRNTLLEIKNHFIKPEGQTSEIDQLKKNTPENIGATIGGTVAEALAAKLGLNKPTEKPKPTPVISASK